MAYAPGAATAVAPADPRADAAPAAPQPPAVLDEYSSPYVHSLSLAAAVEDGLFRLIVSFRLAEGWHIYWRNPGDTGLAPDFALLDPPAGYALGDIDWPVPDRILIGPLANYGYSERVDYRLSLLVNGAALTGPAALAQHLIVEARWLVCRIECVPETARLRYRPGDLLSSEERALLSPLPSTKALEGLILADVPARWQSDNRLAAVSLGQWSPPASADTAAAADLMWHLAAADPGLIEPASEQLLIQDEEGRWSVLFEPGSVYAQLLADARAQARPFQALLMASPPGQAGESGALTHFYTDRRWTYPVHISPDAGPPASALAPGAETADTLLAWLVAISFAFLGGVLLNAMPCVFPVLSIKLMSIAQLLHTPGARPLFVAAIFALTAGILLTMLLLAGALLALRGADQLLAWGFQLQSPSFVLFIGALMLLVALNLSGVFGFHFNVAARARPPGRPVGVLGRYFFSGLLMVLLASPCTAPFMVAAFGYAWQQSWPLALSVFVFLGLGLAAPYWLLLPFPGLGRRLPAPGAWMEDIQRLLAFPIYATVLWLVWVLSRQTDALGLAWALVVLWLTGLIAWLFGRFVQRPRPRRFCVAIVLALILCLSALIVPATVSHLSSATATQASSPVRAAGAQRWSVGRVAQIRQDGRALLINFTAAWCATCLWNERAVFSQDQFRQALSASDTAYLVADWTGHDESIARALARYGRFSVPTYVYYPPGSGAEAVLLGQLPDLESVLVLLREKR